MQTEIGVGRERPKGARGLRPTGPGGHGAGRGEPSRAQGLENPRGDGGREREIVGAQREGEGHGSSGPVENPPLSCAFSSGKLDLPNMCRAGQENMSTPSDQTPELSVIIPVFNEGDNLRPLLERLIPALACVQSFEIVFVDDGSSDNTLQVARDLNAADPRVTAVSFSRNFGKEIAIAAGVDAARGKAAVIMDADLQHPPETIAAFVEKWREGYQNIFGGAAEPRDRFARAQMAHRPFLQAVPRVRRNRPARGRGRFPPARPRRARRAENPARARALLEGPLRLDRLQEHRRALRGRRSAIPANPSSPIASSPASRSTAWCPSAPSR